MPGTISGVPVGIAIFVDFYNYTSNSLLITWFIFYNLALCGLTGLYILYKRRDPHSELDNWLRAYSVMMSICAIMWGLCVFLLPDNLTRQYFAFIALFLIATGYATGSIGVFRLCVVTLSIIVIPLIIWCFLQNSFFYNLLGCFSIIYLFFMSSINRRSTEWFKTSLKLKLENTLVSYQANHDVLTDLPNQRLLEQYIDQAVQQANQQKQAFALICFSLNRMEVINDSLGHHIGNLVVKAVATRLTDFSVAQSPLNFIITISRKDTFNILLSPIPSDYEERIKAIFAILDEPFYIEQQSIKLTASVGVAVYPQDALNLQSLVVNADTAMLRAKQFGGNHVEFYRTEINTLTAERVELENDLHVAVQKNQFILHYQPLVDIHNNEIAGMEALIRWNHPTKGFISPLQFISLAEEIGLIVPIGQWVLEEACRQTVQWHKMGYDKLHIAVNLSEKQLREGNLIEVIKSALHKTGLEPHFLELEITETAIIDEGLISQIKEFKSLGISLAVDDFGTGYSGLSYLKKFEVDKLKIDQSFVKDIPHNEESMTIVSAIIAMSKELDLRTLAEGVETKEQLNFLKSKGCDYVQGYYYSKPLEATAFTKLLETQEELLLTKA